MFECQDSAVPSISPPHCKLNCVPKLLLDDVFEQKNEITKAVEEELEKAMSASGFEIDGPRRPTHFAVRDWAASFRTASRAGRSRRVPPENEPAAVQDRTGRESPIAIPSENDELERIDGNRLRNRLERNGVRVF
ncbi:hypothetical protein F2Q70_00020401 [Brassica cretica]|uniref:Uncharacterized protein n=1 Tax=Brassica cretica TaxID=69181 RepID=A0A8S9GUF5_BRACR|nr:hypothetical protein F2Q70_00020401 [Brassica cretica]